MLHIKDIEAFANINEALFRASNAQRADGGEAREVRPARLAARMMGTARTTGTADAAARTDRPAAEVVQLVPASERAAIEDGAESVPGAGYDFDIDPVRPMTMAGLFRSMMFGRR